MQKHLSNNCCIKKKPNLIYAAYYQLLQNDHLFHNANLSIMRLHCVACQIFPCHNAYNLILEVDDNHMTQTKRPKLAEYT